MTDLPTPSIRTASPGIKQVAFDHKCQVIPEGDCAELRKLLSFCPIRAKSPPIVGSRNSPGLIARAISPQLARAKSPNLKRATTIGNAAPNSSTSWRTRVASWGSNKGAANGYDSVSSVAASSSTSPPPQTKATSPSSVEGPRLVAPVPSRGMPSLMAPFDDDESVDVSPSNESVDFDDIHAEFQNAISGVAMHQLQSPVATVHAAISPILQQSRPISPFVRSVSELRSQRPLSIGRPKSCLVRSSTPQAPGPPRLLDDGMTPLRATRSHDRVPCFAQRRRADGVPVVCPSPSPLSTPDDEAGMDDWSSRAEGSQSAHKHKQAAVVPEKSKMSRWRRFRRAASEDTARFESNSVASLASEAHLDDAAVRRKLQAGRWPFEAPLNAECSCKNCQDKIEVGLMSNYEPKWTRAARIRWLEGQEDVTAPAKDSAASSAAGPKQLRHSSSRTAIQADEVAQLHNETVHPMTAAELAEEPMSPAAERGEPDAFTPATTEPVIAVPKLPNPTGLQDGDDTLRREIMAKRQQKARQSPVLRHGARSMMRQIEEAERREQEAARARSYCRTASGSGRSSPVSPAMSPSLMIPSSPDTVSTPSLEPQAPGQTPTPSSFFEMPPAPPERVRSPLIPADEAFKPRYVRSSATEDSAGMSMASVAQSLEEMVSAADCPASGSPHIQQ
ncbi:hypothetical protein PSEUBRA_006167 [Kalmanozyma brasiliensis GHG001]|uniref:uncharacterized protein n=1 Tax=Kalmanozyma brasiliensis (strain GHG001) TaxID=1365824 RepID=UPI001CE84D9F|nr:uncharacterized protein PSEUBRA_006167 [Kalmanozyma brasiliensis GHG001]EST04847.2 hypothetical protein PSEUBRA_006167 [Kalmanozyma brasiliensis GHG001]